MDDLSNPLVSIIIAARNAEPTIRSCCMSLSENLRQVPESYWEVILIDGGCTDRTVDIARSFDFPLRFTQAPLGVSNAYNAGVAAACGEFALFLNADDEWAPDFLPLIVKHIQDEKRRRNPVRFVVYTSISFIDRHGDELYRRRPPLYLSWVHKRQSLILHPNAAYPTYLLKQHPFPVYPDLRPADQEQVYNLMKHARPVRLTEAHYRYRIWANSGTVVRAAQHRPEARSLIERVSLLICRAYVYCFESHIVKRAAMALLQGRSFWRHAE